MAGVNITIGADSRKASRELKTFETKTQKALKSIQKGFKERIGHKLFDGLSGAVSQIPGILMGAVDSASSLNEELGKSEAVFGESAKAISEWSKTTADGLGVSRVEALQATGDMGNLIRTFGISGDEAAKMARRLVELAADMGSFNEASIEDTLLAISSALRGESAPISRFGADISAAQLKLHAFAQGIGDGKTALSGSARVMAIYNKVLEDTALQHGNFADTSDDLANSQKRIKAQLADASTELGGSMLPAMQAFVDILKEVDFTDIAKDLGNLISGLVDFAAATKDAGDRWNQWVDKMEKTTAFGKMSKNISMFHRLAMKKVLGLDAKKDIPKISYGIEFEDQDIGLSDESKRFQQIMDELDAEMKEAEKLREAERSKRLSEISFWYQDAVDSINDAVEAQEEKNERLKEERSILKGINAERKSFEQRRMDALAEFGIGGEKRKKDRIAELLDLGFSADEASGMAGTEAKIESLLSTRDSLYSMSGQMTPQAVSSMQRVGGGGGSYGGSIDVQKQQADLQSKMVELLQDIKNGSPQRAVSDF